MRQVEEDSREVSAHGHRSFLSRVQPEAQQAASLAQPCLSAATRGHEVKDTTVVEVVGRQKAVTKASNLLQLRTAGAIPSRMSFEPLGLA